MSTAVICRRHYHGDEPLVSQPFRPFKTKIGQHDDWNLLCFRLLSRKNRGTDLGYFKRFFGL